MVSYHDDDDDNVIRKDHIDDENINILLKHKSKIIIGFFIFIGFLYIIIFQLIVDDYSNSFTCQNPVLNGMSSNLLLTINNYILLLSSLLLL